MHLTPWGKEGRTERRSMEMRHPDFLQGRTGGLVHNPVEGLTKMGI